MKKVIELVVLGAVLVVFLFVGRNKLAVIFYNRGNEYSSRGQYARARDLFLQSIAVDPSLAVAQYSLGQAYQHLGDKQSAVFRLKKAMKQDPHFVLSYTSLASLYAGQEQYDQALAVLADAGNKIGFNPAIEDQSKALTFEYLAFELNAATDAYIAGDRLQAYERVRKAIQIKNDYPFVYYALGYFLYTDKKYNDAQQALQQAILLEPKMWFANRIMGDIAFERAEYAAAARYYQAAVTVCRDSAQLYNNLGLAFMNLERYNEAIVPLQNAVRLAPGNINMRYSLASVFRDGGRLADALREYGTVVQYQPEFPNVHNDIAAIYENQERLEEARKEYAVEIENSLLRLHVAPLDPVYLTSLAYAYCGNGMFDKATKAIEQALRLAPAYREAYLTQARIYQKTHRPREALVALEKAKTLARNAGFISAQIDTAKHDLAMSQNNPQPWQPAQLVVLKNGGNLRGTIIEELPDRILLETQVGTTRGTLTLYRNTIEHISENK